MRRYKFPVPLEEVQAGIGNEIGLYLAEGEEERLRITISRRLFSEKVSIWEVNGEFPKREIAYVKRITWSPLRRREGIVIPRTNDSSIISEDSLYLAAGCKLEARLEELDQGRVAAG